MRVSSSYKLIIGSLIAIPGSDWQADIQGEKNKNCYTVGNLCYIHCILYMCYVLYMFIYMSYIE